MAFADLFAPFEKTASSGLTNLGNALTLGFSGVTELADASRGAASTAASETAKAAGTLKTDSGTWGQIIGSAWSAVSAPFSAAPQVAYASATATGDKVLAAKTAVVDGASSLFGSIKMGAGIGAFLIVVVVAFAVYRAIKG